MHVVPKTIQIRDVDDEVYAGLARRAAEEGVSVPELLRIEAARIAARPTIREWLRRTREAPDTGITRVEIVAALDEIRGPWPDADR
jgi:antitoxin FitA